MLTSQNPRILIKFKDFLDGDPPLLLGMVHLFCTVPNFLQAVPTRDTKNKKPAGSLQDPGGVLSQVAGISDSTVQLYFYDIGNIGDPPWGSHPGCPFSHRLQELLNDF